MVPQISGFSESKVHVNYRNPTMVRDTNRDLHILCTTDERIRSALIYTGPHPFTLECRSPWGHVLNDPDIAPRRCLVSDVLIGVRVALASNTLTACRWLKTKGEATHDTRYACR